MDLRDKIYFEVNLLNDIPQEAKDALNDPALQHSVEEMPGSDRFKAMVLGLSAFNALRGDHEPSEPNQSKPMLPHAKSWE